MKESEKGLLAALSSNEAIEKARAIHAGPDKRDALKRGIVEVFARGLYGKLETALQVPEEFRKELEDALDKIDVYDVRALITLLELWHDKGGYYAARVIGYNDPV